MIRYDWHVFGTKSSVFEFVVPFVTLLHSSYKDLHFYFFYKKIIVNSSLFLINIALFNFTLANVKQF